MTLMHHEDGLGLQTSKFKQLFAVSHETSV